MPLRMAGNQVTRRTCANAACKKNMQNRWNEAKEPLKTSGLLFLEVKNEPKTNPISSAFSALQCENSASWDTSLEPALKSKSRFQVRKGVVLGVAKKRMDGPIGSAPV